MGVRVVVVIGPHGGCLAQPGTKPGGLLDLSKDTG